MYEKYAKLRDSKGVSDYKVAKDCGFGRATLSEWKKGVYTPKIDKLKKLAKYFNVPIDYFSSPEQTDDQGITNLKALSPAKDDFLERSQRDQAFQEHIRLLFSLADEDKLSIYKFIELAYYSQDSKKDDCLDA